MALQSLDIVRRSATTTPSPGVREPRPGLAVAEIDRTLQQELRGRFPALAHRRFEVTGVTGVTRVTLAS